MWQARKQELITNSRNNISDNSWIETNKILDDAVQILRKLYISGQQRQHCGPSRRLQASTQKLVTTYRISVCHTPQHHHLDLLMPHVGLNKYSI